METLEVLRAAQVAAYQAAPSATTEAALAEAAKAYHAAKCAAEAPVADSGDRLAVIEAASAALSGETHD